MASRGHTSNLVKQPDRQTDRLRDRQAGTASDWSLLCSSLIGPWLQLFDKTELLKCIKKLVEVDQEWVPYSQDASLYIRPTFIGTEVSPAHLFLILPDALTSKPTTRPHPTAVPGRVSGQTRHDLRHRVPSGAVLRHRLLQPRVAAR